MLSPTQSVIHTLILSLERVSFLAEAIIDPSRDELLKKQAASKAYYDSFPNIDDATNETRPDIKKAEEFTKAILNNLPSGNPTERDTLCHVLNKLVGQQNQQCLFYDSANGINLHDASGNLVNADSKDKPFVLKLESSKGLGDGKSPKADEDDLKLVETLTSLIEQKKSHSIIEDVRDRLAKAYGVEKNYIIIENFYFGSFNIVYTVLNLAATAVQALQQISQKLRAQFHQFVSAKIHPLLYRPAFDISCFDARGNKTFSNQAETHQVGPPGRTKTYTTAAGWTRYGLNVLSKYGNDDWLHPFGHAGNWYRAFHGTRNAQAAFLRDYDVRRDNTGPVSLLAVADIYKGGFQPSSDGRYGSGVYCSPNPTFPERGYIREVVINTKQGMKNFKFMLQVAVNPDGVTFGNADIWVVPRSQDIRPYGILIKGV